MNKIINRILLFCVGIPSIIAVILLLPWANHFVYNILVVISCFIASLEMVNIINHPTKTLKPIPISLLSSGLPLITYLIMQFDLPALVWEVYLLLVLYILYTRLIFTSKEEAFSLIIPRLCAGLLVLIYPGLFSTYLVKLSSLPHAGFAILFFLMITFANDSLAYVAGMLFGRRSTGIIPISPNKSLHGFIGGILGALIVASLCFLVYPAVFVKKYYLALVVGLIIGIVAILGDLVESALKRSALVKDSGWVMGGRGGMLDSMDSILFAVPVYYFLLSFLH